MEKWSPNNSGAPKSNIKSRKRMLSGEYGKIEKEGVGFITQISHRFLNDILEVPQGAFSAITYHKNEQGELVRTSPELDALIANHFTNFRYIVDKINGILVTTKDPREKYEGDIELVEIKIKVDIHEFKLMAKAIKADYKKRYEEGEISETEYLDVLYTLSKIAKVYDILQKEIELKKRGYEATRYLQTIGKLNDEVTKDLLFLFNTPLEIKYLPGGHFVVFRGYTHVRGWYSIFGRKDTPFNLPEIYKNADYIAIETTTSANYGEGLQKLVNTPLEIDQTSYPTLIKDLIESGFDGMFMEIDSRKSILYQGQMFLDLATFLRFVETGGEKVLFNYIKKINPALAEKVKTPERLVGYIFNQSVINHESNSLTLIKDGTGFSAYSHKHPDLSVIKQPSGYELGQTAVSDALSVLRILVLSSAMNKRHLPEGLIVDFQGAAHNVYKSFFMDHPWYALEVVLTNIHEILLNHPDVKDVTDVFDKIDNMDEETWRWVFDFITTIPLAPVIPDKNNPSQKIINRNTEYIATKRLTRKQQEALDEIIKQLTVITSHK